MLAQPVAQDGRPGGAPQRRRCRRTGGASRRNPSSGLEWRVPAGPSAQNRPERATRGFGRRVRLSWCGAAVPPAPSVPRRRAAPRARPAAARRRAGGRRRRRAAGRDGPGRRPARPRAAWPIPPATAPGDVVFRGGGWGHGLGHEPVRRPGRGPAGLHRRPDPDPLLRRHRGRRPRRCPATSGCGCSTTATGSTSRRSRVALTWVLPGCVVPPPPTPTPTPTPTDPAATPTPAPTATPAPAPTGPPCPPAQPDGARWQLRLDDATHSQFVLWDVGVDAEEAALGGRLGSRPAAAPAVRRRRPAHHLARLVDLPGPLGALGLDGVHRRRRR